MGKETTHAYGEALVLKFTASSVVLNSTEYNVEEASKAVLGRRLVEGRAVLFHLFLLPPLLPFLLPPPLLLVVLVLGLLGFLLCHTHSDPQSFLHTSKTQKVLVFIVYWVWLLPKRFSSKVGLYCLKLFRVHYLTTWHGY